MSLPTLVIAGIDVPIMSWLEYEQTIEPIGGSTLRRMANGAAFKLSHWRKWRVSISASGWIPSALNAIDYNQPFEIELPMPVGLRIGEALPPGWVLLSTKQLEHKLGTWVACGVLPSGRKSLVTHSARVAMSKIFLAIVATTSARLTRRPVGKQLRGCRKARLRSTSIGSG